MYIDGVAGILGAQGIQLLIQCRVVQGFARPRIFVQQRNIDDGTLEIGSHELADLTRPLDIGPQLRHSRRAAVVAVGDDGIAIQPFFCDSHPAGVAGPQRLQEGSVHPRHQKQRVTDLAQGLQVFLVKDGAVLGSHRNAQRIATSSQLLALLQEVDDVRMSSGDCLFKAGSQLNIQGLPSEHQGCKQTDEKYPEAVIENQPFGNSAAGRVEVLQPADHRLGSIVRDMAHGAIPSSGGKD
ncbi:hypothetical protein D3C71_923080 [compost metagenome]